MCYLQSLKRPHNKFDFSVIILKNRKETLFVTSCDILIDHKSIIYNVLNVGVIKDNSLFEEYTLISTIYLQYYVRTKQCLSCYLRGDVEMNLVSMIGK